MAKRSLISNVNLLLVRGALDSSWNKGPSVEDLREMYLSIAETGQISVPEHPIMRVTPIRKGSVLESSTVRPEKSLSLFDLVAKFLGRSFEMVYFSNLTSSCKQRKMLSSSP